MIHVEASDLVKLQKALAKVDKTANKRLNAEVRALAMPLVEKVREAALEIPTSPSRTIDINVKEPAGALGLRKGIARAVELRVGSSARKALVRIRVSGTKFNKATGKPRKLPRYMEGLAKRPWRHPVISPYLAGNDHGSWLGKWAEQSAHPFLRPTVLLHKGAIREKLLETYMDALSIEIAIYGLNKFRY